MDEEILNLSTKRYAVVTGGNKGIGLEICKQLGSKGITVILTARDEKRGAEAQEKLNGLYGRVVFHQLDVRQPESIASLVEFVQKNYGKLDILVNNAGINGLYVVGDSLIIKKVIQEDLSSIFGSDGTEPTELNIRGEIIHTYELAKECIETNYLGAKRMTEALIPLLHHSDSPRILNVSSMLGNLRLQTNEWAKRVLSSAPDLTAEKVDEVVDEFLKHFEQGLLEENGWPVNLAAYKVSKEAINAYTRIKANEYPGFMINCATPGFVKTDMTFNIGSLSEAEGAECLIKVVLLPNGGPSGCFFSQGKASFFG